MSRFGQEQMGQQRTRLRHERILDAALDVFTSRGYRGASIDDVASAAETSKGGVYFHFPGKDALFLALLDRSARLLLARIADTVAAEPDPVAKVDAALLGLLRTFAGHRRLARLFLVEAMGAGPRFHARMVDAHAQFERFVRDNLDEAVNQGIIAPLDTEVASRAWFGALNQVVTRWVLSETPDRLEEAYPALRSLLLRSVGVDPRRSGAASPRKGDVPIEHARAAVDRAAALRSPVLLAWTTRLSSADPIAFFAEAGACGLARSYWERPDDGVALVGAGTAWAIELDATRPFESAQQAWHGLVDDAIVGGDEAAGPIAFAGFAFDPERPRTDLWRGFPPGRLTLPEALLTRRGEAAWLTVSCLVRPGDDAEALVGNVRQRVPSSLTSTQPGTRSPWASPTGRGDVSVTDVLPGDEWRRMVENAAEGCRDGPMEKVVLARAVRATAGEGIDAASVLANLRASYPGCAIFALESEGACFLGATPERLVRLRDGLIEVSSLAGTIGRGATPEEDARLGDCLMTSAKNRHEHEVVARILTEALDGVLDGLDVPDRPRLLKVRNLQHLYTPIRGRLAAGASLLGVAGRLHPTPAVGGHPRELALRWIREREALDRGWYAGAVGWIDRAGEGELVVALRSALLREADATLFAGCGIVGDSEPQAEYEESVLKLRTILSALGAAT